MPTFRSGVFLVHVDAEVLGDDTRPIIDLAKEDFRVLDGGLEQTIVAFSQGEQPLDLILLVDVSSSMRRQIKRLAEVARTGFRELRRGDRVCVMKFADDSHVLAPLSEDLKVAQQAIDRMLGFPFNGRTRIQRAISDAAGELLSSRESNHQRRAVLVITDDLGIPARHKGVILEKLWEADALLSGIVVPNRIGLKGLLAPLGATRPGGIEEFVEKTGGDMIRSDDMSTSFPEMMHRVRNRYTLYYKLADAHVGSLRKIEVQLSPGVAHRFAGARVLARTAYRLRERDQYGFANR